MVDVGANAGYFALLGARRVGRQGRILAVEPHPTSVRRLKRHLEINRVSNVSVVEAAAGDRTGRARLAVRESLSMNRLDRDGALEVRITTIDGLLEEAQSACPPSLIKVDVEGEEVAVLEGMRQTLDREARPALLVETHGSARHREVLRWLESLHIEVKFETVDAVSGGGRVEAAGSREAR